MAKYDINININTTTAAHLLGGLARAYREIPASAQASVSIDIRITIYDILSQLELQGVDLKNSRSPFKSFVKLVNYDKPF